MKYKDTYIINYNDIFNKLNNGLESLESLERHITTNCYTTNYKEEKNILLATQNNDQEYIDYVKIMSKKIKIVLKKVAPDAPVAEQKKEQKTIKLIHKYIFDNYLQSLDNKWHFLIDDKLKKILKYNELTGSYKNLHENIIYTSDISFLKDAISS